MKYKKVQDLGSSAYLMIHGFKPIGRYDRSIVFKIDSFNEEDQIEKLCLDYLKSDFRKFDSCLMSLKKIDYFKKQDYNIKSVNDLGCSAYLMLHDCEIVGRENNNFKFKVINEDEFHNMITDYLTSEFHRFDSYIMSLKKLINYLPNINLS